MATPHLVRPPVASLQATGVFLCPGFYARVIAAAVFVLTTTACTGGNDGTPPRLLVLTLPASVLVLAIAAILCVLAGIGAGVTPAFLLLRAADTAAAKYHRAVVASVLDASRDLHTAVEGIVRHTRRRIDQLRAQLAHLRETQR